MLDDNGCIRIIDFGVSCQFDTSNTDIIAPINNLMQSKVFTSLKGSLPWASPEVICETNYGRKADIWSLGCTLIELLTCKTPWGNIDTIEQAIFRIGQSTDIPTIPNNISHELFILIDSCLKRNQDERPTAKELLNHIFLTKDS